MFLFYDVCAFQVEDGKPIKIKQKSVTTDEDKPDPRTIVKTVGSKGHSNGKFLLSNLQPTPRMRPLCTGSV